VRWALLAPAARSVKIGWMKPRDLRRLGIPDGPPIEAALDAVRRARQAGWDFTDLRAALRRVAETPADFAEDEIFATLAARLAAPLTPEGHGREPRREPRSGPAPHRIWGHDHDSEALRQMARAVSLPVSLMGALMPDAHVGYGLPIGGVLATDNAVIPYAVGMDIACRMKMTVFDLPVTALDHQRDRLRTALERETRFGVGASYKDRRRHDVMDADWGVSPVTQRLKDKAWAQLGTSGSGNHFVEFGVLTVMRDGIGLAPGDYLALLSHSGSRGTGGQVATHYSRLAARLHPELPKDLQQLAWLDLDREPGQEYWAAMELMGRYASANHELIHRQVRAVVGGGVMADVENHHNFAWREVHLLPNGQRRSVIVHRKGATPAGRGVLGIIPGSMGAPGYVVRGLGEASALMSAAHGAGRRMSRKKAQQKYSWRDLNAVLQKRKVELLSAGLDEVPMAYKDIDQVMAAQADLVEQIARFEPRLVKMAPGGERPED
jgi:tRNA-splicing ligase RtcB (3'-phosphate/5'-hydroxy nucleic acid ligase)